MEQDLSFRIILERPPAGVDFGLQRGKGSKFEVVQTQRSKVGDLTFEFDARVKDGKTGEPVLLPVWIMAYRYKDQVHRFLVNGQTGRCTGTAPTSYAKIAGVVGIVVAVIVGIVICMGIVGAMTGR